MAKRTSIVSLVLLLLTMSLPVVPESSAALGSLRSYNSHYHPPPGSRVDAALVPLQGHRGPPLHSIQPAALSTIPEVRRELDHYASPAGRRYLEIVLRRGDPYLPFIHGVAEAAGLPWELTFLPIVESAFLNTTISRSGAAGLWQFMLNSIDPYQMRVDQWLDERRDFWKATYGALAKLKTNYELLGDWLLAIGAYNCGLGCMQRAIEAAGSRDFWELSRGGYLPVETRGYVPRFLAVAHYASYPGRYGLPSSWEEGTNWRRVAVRGPVHLNRLAESAGIPLSELTNHNQELNQPVTPPLARGYMLKVKAQYADSIEEALSREDTTLADLESYIVQSGDTLYALGRHYGVSVDLILSYNPGVTPRLLRPGSRILIPLMQPMPPYRGPEQTKVPELFAATGEHTIRPGDTLSGLAREYRTSPEALAFNNGMSLDTVLIPGAVLTVPAPESSL